MAEGKTNWLLWGGVIVGAAVAGPYLLRKAAENPELLRKAADLTERGREKAIELTRRGAQAASDAARSGYERYKSSRGVQGTFAGVMCGSCA